MPNPGNLGGARKGAGRKKAPHTIATETARRRLVQRVESNLDKLLDAKFALALGHFREETNDDGTKRIYLAEPDGKAIEFLVNQTIGKAKETVDADVKGSITINVRSVLQKAVK